jgi:hypothetical protein
MKSIGMVLHKMPVKQKSTITGLGYKSIPGIKIGGGICSNLIQIDWLSVN